jgi:hypothetical protein
MFHPSRWSLGLVITKDSLNINNPSLSSFELSFKREREREKETHRKHEPSTKRERSFKSDIFKAYTWSTAGQSGSL